MEPTQALRGFFLLATSTVLLVNSIPPLRSRFLVYGPRAAPTTAEGSTPTPILIPQRSETTAQHSRTPPRARDPANGDNPISRLLDGVASVQVPHSWFTHFYLVSVASSIFWAAQILWQGRVFDMVLAWQQDASLEKKDALPGMGMTLDQVAVMWLLMAMQGVRRLYECVVLAKPSQSKMSILHWVLGVGFYLAMGIAIWVEGIPLLRETRPTIWDLGLAGPSMRTLLCISGFLFASGAQHDCHRYLAPLEKYTLPEIPMFQAFICPHYTAECVIYLCLAILAAPEGSLMNTTIFTALIFITVNLGITAELSREWYAMKFGEEKVKGRWRMVPYFY